MAAFSSAMLCSIELNVWSRWFPSARELTAFRTSPRVKSERLRAPWRSEASFSFWYSSWLRRNITKRSLRLLHIVSSRAQAVRKDGPFARVERPPRHHLVVDFYGYGTLQGFHSHYDLKIVVFPQQDALQPI